MYNIITICTKSRNKRAKYNLNVRTLTLKHAHYTHTLSLSLSLTHTHTHTHTTTSIAPPPHTHIHSHNHWNEGERGITDLADGEVQLLKQFWRNRGKKHAWCCAGLCSRLWGLGVQKYVGQSTLYRHKGFETDECQKSNEAVRKEHKSWECAGTEIKKARIPNGGRELAQLSFWSTPAWKREQLG